MEAAVGARFVDVDLKGADIKGFSAGCANSNPHTTSRALPASRVPPKDSFRGIPPCSHGNSRCRGSGGGRDGVARAASHELQLKPQDHVELTIPVSTQNFHA